MEGAVYPTGSLYGIRRAKYRLQIREDFFQERAEFAGAVVEYRLGHLQQGFLGHRRWAGSQQSKLHGRHSFSKNAVDQKNRAGD